MVFSGGGQGRGSRYDDAPTSATAAVGEGHDGTFVPLVTQFCPSHGTQVRLTPIPVEPIIFWLSLAGPTVSLFFILSWLGGLACGAACPRGATSPPAIETLARWPGPLMSCAPP